MVCVAKKEVEGGEPLLEEGLSQLGGQRRAPQGNDIEAKIRRMSEN